MQPQLRSKISKFLYSLSTENRAQANKELGEIVKTKVDNMLSREFQKVKDSFSKENS
jgi:hypothetical protein